MRRVRRVETASGHRVYLRKPDPGKDGTSPDPVGILVLFLTETSGSCVCVCVVQGLYGARLVKID